MYASAANYGLAATYVHVLMVQVHREYIRLVPPPLNRKLRMTQIATTKSYPPTRTRTSFVVPHDMSM